MTLPEITYSILEVIREGNIVDDERIDLRLIERFVHAARAESIVQYLNTSKEPIENTAQYIDVTMAPVTNGDSTIVRSTTTIPEPLDTRFGLTILEAYPQSDLLAIPLSVVEFNRLRWCGQNQFNKKIIFVAYRNGYLYAKASDDTHKLLEDVAIKMILNNPTDDPNFNKNTDNYPINDVIYEYIKDRVLKTDIRLLMAGIADEINDATGDIQK